MAGLFSPSPAFKMATCALSELHIQFRRLRMEGRSNARPGVLPLSVIIPTYRHPELLETLLASLDQASNLWKPAETIVVDDSHDGLGTIALIAATHNAKYVANPSRGYGSACNTGARVASQPMLIFLNQDLSPTTSDFLRISMAEISLRGLVALGIAELVHGSTLDPRGPRGPAVLVASEAFRALGGYDERYIFGWEDWDFEVRLRSAGWPVGSTVSTVIPHKGGGTEPSASEFRLFHNARGLVLFTLSHPCRAVQSKDVFLSAFNLVARALRTGKTVALRSILEGAVSGLFVPRTVTSAQHRN